MHVLRYSCIQHELFERFEKQSLHNLLPIVRRVD